jgi:DNA-binding response OmpR family regulator
MDHTARRGMRPILLTNKEFALLEHLMLNRGHCVSRVQLLDAVWNLDPVQTTNIVDVYINYLRRKLQDPPPGGLIRTVRGKGYVIPMDADMTHSILPVTSGLPARVPAVVPAVAFN